MIVVDWVMRKSTNNVNNGIPWRDGYSPDNLDFTDDLALTSSNQDNLQDKTNNLVNYAKQVGLQINIKKAETMHTS